MIIADNVLLEKILVILFLLSSLGEIFRSIIAINELGSSLFLLIFGFLYYFSDFIPYFLQFAVAKSNHNVAEPAI